MAISELITPSSRIDSSTYVETHTSPRRVVKQTSKALNLIFSDHISDKQPVSDYLTGFTIPLIDKAANAIPTLQLIANDIGFEDYEDIRVFIGKDGSPETIHDELEAFDFSHIVFVDMSKKFKMQSFVSGFWSRDTLRPPIFINEFMNRFDEMRKVTESLANQDPNLKSDVHFHRTVAFFKTGEEYPLYSEKSKSSSEIIRETSDRLIQSCNFSDDFV